LKKILYTIVILGALAGFFLFSSPGLDTLKQLPDSQPEAMWAPFMYYNIARLHESMGRHDTAAEIYDQMLNIYDSDYRKKSEYVEHELSKHYIPYALYRKGLCWKVMGDNEYNRSTKQSSEGKEEEARESRELSRKHYREACRIFREFVNRYAFHKLYSDANRLYSETEIKLSS